MAQASGRRHIWLLGALLALSAGALLWLMAQQDGPDATTPTTDLRQDAPPGEAMLRGRPAGAPPAGATTASDTKPGDATAYLRAVIRDADGKPIEGLEVVIEAVKAAGEHASGALRTTTDAAGRLHLTAPRGKYMAQAVDPALCLHRDPLRSPALLAWLSSSGTCGVELDAQVEGPTEAIIAYAVHTIRGRVEDPQGRAVAGAVVHAVRWDLQVDVHVRMARKVDGGVLGDGADGEVRLPNLPPPSSFPEWGHTFDTPDDPSNEILAHRDPLFELSRAIQRGQFRGSAESDADGNFAMQITGTRGRLRIVVQPQPLGDLAHAGARREFESVPREPVKLVVDSGRELSVEVKGEDNKPIAGAVVVLLRARERPSPPNAEAWLWRWNDLAQFPPRAHKTKDSGIAQFRHLPDAKLWCFVAATDRTSWGQPIQVKPTQHSVSLRVSGLVRYRGRVQGGTSGRVEVHLTVSPPWLWTAWPGISRRRVTLDADGRFLIEAPAGSGHVFIAHDTATGRSGMHDTRSMFAEAQDDPDQEVVIALEEPASMVTYRLKAITHGGNETATTTPLPKDAKLIIHEHHSGRRSEVPLKGLQTPPVREALYESYDYEIQDGQGTLRLRLERDSSGEPQLVAVEKLKRQEDGSWKPVWTNQDGNDP